jgi:hypothetical protein
MFQKLGSLFDSLRGAAQSQQAARSRTFQELVDVLVGVEIGERKTAPDAAEIRSVLAAAEASADDLQSEVARRLEIGRLQRQVSEREEIQQALGECRQRRQTEAGRFASQQAKHRERLREIDGEIRRLDARQDAMSQAGAKLEALLGGGVPMKTLAAGELPIPGYGPRNVLAPDSEAGAAVRELYRWGHANRVPARCPADPATIPAQAQLRTVLEKIAVFEAEMAKHPDRCLRMPSRLSTEHDRLRAEVDRATERWATWHEFEKRRQAVDAMAAK